MTPDQLYHLMVKAINLNNIKLVKMAIAEGADVTVRDNQAIKYASYRNFKDMVNTLKLYGAKL